MKYREESSILDASLMLISIYIKNCSQSRLSRNTLHTFCDIQETKMPKKNIRYLLPILIMTLLGKMNSKETVGNVCCEFRLNAVVCASS